MRQIKLISLVILVAVLLTGCRWLFGGPDYSDAPLATLSNEADWSAVTDSDMNGFRSAFMQSFDVERGREGMQPASVGPPTVALDDDSGMAPQATVPVSGSMPFSGGTISDYPEPGMTTTYTVASEGSGVYRITSTTQYPASNTTVDKYIEEYLIKDVAPTGSWTIADPVVNAGGTEDRTHREKMELHFDDGSVRYESIVYLAFPDDANDGFAPFDIAGSLFYPDFAYPDSDSNAVYSSIVVYTHERSVDSTFDFWSGNQNEAILGVRFYTEHFTSDSQYYKGTTVAYERAINELTTTGGTFTATLGDIFVGSEHTTLAESVLRREVVFPVEDGNPTPNAIGANTVMRTHVVDISDRTDFMLQLLNDDATVLKDWDGATYYVPSGPDAAEILADSDDPEGTEVLTQTVATNPDGTDLVLNEDPGSSDLSTLYRSILAGNVVNVSTADDIAGGLEGDGTVAEFDGDAGLAVPDPGTVDPGAGTVEAWIYMNKRTSWSGIVHKGDEPDFSDESWSLQFWGNRGNVAFATVQQTPSYKYSYTRSPLRLTTGKWYYLVGTWDGSKIQLYIFGDGVTKGQNNYYMTQTTQNYGPEENDANIVIGAQFSDANAASGYYGSNGRINGVIVTYGTARDADTLENFYNANKSKTANWNN